MACEHYHELLWDYLYGLLDPAEAQNLRAHVEICPECRAALAEAESHKQMLARAAHVLSEVPMFTLPDQEATPLLATPALGAGPALGLPTPPPEPRRPRRFWPVWAAAAALLAAAFGLNEAYQTGLGRHEAEVDRRRKDVETIEVRFAALQTNVKKEEQAKTRLLQEQIPPLLRVMGPAQVRSDIASNFVVSTRDQAGRLRSATVTTSVVNPATNEVLFKQTDSIQKGEGKVQVPGLQIDRPGARMVMEAKAEKGAAKIEEMLRVAEPIHTSHLALNKSVYNVGELLFFRTLTLDRVSLTPPAHPLPLRFSLVDANGKTVKEMPGQTGAGGISGGEMALTPDLLNGNYTFQVNPAAGAQNQILPQNKSLEIVREETPLIEFDRNQYKPGDTVGLTFRGGTNGLNAYANQSVNITVNADGLPVSQAQNQAQVQTLLDNAGNSKNLQFQLPQQIKNGAEIVVNMKVGQKDNNVIQSIPVVPSERTIDFFPEGGNLVAGLPNRVYYRVRTPQGETVDPEGHVIVQADRDVLFESEPRQGLGTFTFTPDPKKAYSVRITASTQAQGATEIQNPFQKLGIQSEGLVLHAPQSVGREGDPVNLILRNQGAARKLFLEITCRGQIVDEQYLDLPPGSHPVKLQPVPGSAGILRITALEATGQQLVPVAERLLYRVPVKRLDVSYEIANGPGPYAAGTNMVMKLKTTDEKNNASPAWMLAAVVDEKYQAEKKEPSLLTHFYIAGDIADSNLDNANLILNDTPASQQALDLFLGTQGWRRFVRGQPATVLALDEKRSKDAAKEASQATLFSLQNTTPQNVQDAYQTALQKEVHELVDRANQERAGLIDQKEIGLQLLGQANRELAQFQQLPREYVRLALGIVTLGLLAAAALFLVVGLLRLIRKKGRPTTGFGAAFCCLFACLFLYLAAGGLPDEELARASVPSQPWPEFTGANIQTATARPTDKPTSTALAASPPLGYFVAQAAIPSPKMEAKSTASSLRAGGVSDNPAQRNETMLARGQNFGLNPVQNNAFTDLRRELQESTKANEELKRRFANASAKVKGPAAGPPQLPAAAPVSGGFGGLGGSVGKKKGMAEDQTGNYYYFREYAHRGPQQPGRLDLQDTLLWHPNLFSKDGSAQVSFDLSQNLTTYRVLIYANTPDGRLGFYEGHLEVRPK